MAGDSISPGALHRVRRHGLVYILDPNAALEESLSGFDGQAIFLVLGKTAPLLHRA
jgi:hypothetical protein